MKKLYNRTALFHARAIVGLFALCLLALPSPALAQAIDLKLTNVTVKEAIEALNQRENYSVAIKSAGVDMQRRVSISAQNASIDEVLAQIFADQDITYTITGKSISVTKAAPKSLAADKNQLKGVVKDNLGLPVPGATIIVDGTNNGTTTMSNGDFSLENVKLPAKLVISFIGYQPRTVEVNSYAAIDITLVESSAAHLMAGDVRFRDLDGNNIINNGDGTVKNPGDMRVIGNSLPRYTYSIRGDLNWNGFDFAVFFQGVGKIDWMPSANCYYFWGPYSFPTTTFIAKDFERLAWSEDNRNTYFPRRRSYQTSSAGSMNVKTDRYLQDASYIRLKNITLGYTIPINKRILEKVRVYVSGENLAYWSPLKRYSKTVDPEVATTSATNDCLYPYSRTFSVGVDITF